MANTFAPSGFNVSFSNYASAPNYQERQYLISSSLTSQIATGDPVRLLTTGFIDKYAAGGSTICGVFHGCDYFDPNAGRTVRVPAWRAPSLPASTPVRAYVIDDPAAVFQVQANGAVAVAQADMGANIEITTASAGSVGLSGISTCSVLTSSIATTNTLPFKLRGIVGLQTAVSMPALYPGYDPTTSNNWVEVSFNTNLLVTTTGV